MARKDGAQAIDKRGNRAIGVADHRTARGDEEIRFPRRDLPQTRHYVARARGVAVIAILLRLRDSVLQAEQIEDAAIAVDEIAGAGDALTIGLDQIRDSAARVARRFHHLNAVDRVAIADRAG